MKEELIGSTSVTIRPATLDDAQALARLSNQLGYPSSAEQIVSRLTQILDRRDHVVSVAEISQPDAPTRVAGWIHGSVRRILESDPFVEIGGLIVDEGQRGFGIGGLLMDELERWARGTGCNSVTVRSNVIRERAHAFYQRLGFEVIKTQRVLRKPIGAGCDPNLDLNEG